MRTYILMLFIFCLPLTLLAQNKKSTKKLEEEVKKAKQQEAEAIAWAEQQKKKPMAQPGAALFPFELVDENGKTYSNKDLQPNKPLLMVLFNPGCGHCQELAGVVNAHLSQYKDVNIVFVCGMALKNDLKTFMDKVGIKENTNFKVCAGSEAFINTIFLSKGIPQIMCYSKKLILQKVSFETIDVDESLVQLNK